MPNSMPKEVSQDTARKDSFKEDDPVIENSADKEDELKNELVAEEAKLKQAEDDELKAKQHKLEAELEDEKVEASDSPEKKSASEARADKAEQAAQKLVDVGKETSKKVIKETSKKEQPVDTKVNIADAPPSTL